MCFEKHAHLVFGQHVSIIDFVDFYLHDTFKIFKIGGEHQCCNGFVSEGCLSIEVMPVNIGQSRVKIGNFHICSLHSIVKLHLNFFNLLFSMFLVSFCIISITSCFITKFKILLYLTTLYLFLCDFIPFLSIFIP